MGEIYFVIDVIQKSFCFLTCSEDTRKKTKTKVVLNISAILEVIIASASSVLAVDPIGQLVIRSCRTQWLSDWYTVLYNPTPDYRESLRCTQEAVYPLYVLFIMYIILTIGIGQI